ncbi:MAG TPA: NAD-dependent epimerase/dehydratase family protein [Gemmatimonadaceae bacterium]|nr:NAD-dependent epimerase/dehydratase family protein [Gemmatimonadaceae bacterium]
MSRILITGGAGFVGSNLAERLLADGHEVTVFDDLSAGSLEFLRECNKHPGFRFVRGDLLADGEIGDAISGHEVVFHLAANSDIEKGRRESDRDLRLGTLATFNVLDAMRQRGVRQLVFSSSSVVYGEPTSIPTAEDYGPLLPISLYGASKLACEGLISAFAHNYGIQAWIFRFANICGRHGTHGAIVDFIRKLRANPARLEVLGNGKQAKPNLHVSECVDGMVFGWRHAADTVNYFNLGCDGATSADDIACFVIEAMNLQSVDVVHTGGERGWPGDVPQVRLDCARMAALGWRAKLTSNEAVRRASRELVQEIA